MRKRFLKKRNAASVCRMTLLCMMLGAGLSALPLQAEEDIYLEDDLMTEYTVSEESEDGAADEITITAEENADLITGTYTVPSEWTEDASQSTEEKKVYRCSGYTDQESVSTITCSYLDTNYSVMEYEQLRDMLTNNFLYSNVNAQISTSAVYTKAKDYLYILIVDDSAQDYRDVYHYVVGDYRCFSVEVREYREEASLAESREMDTPQETGQKIAEEFTWNEAW